VARRSASPGGRVESRTHSLIAKRASMESRKSDPVTGAEGKLVSARVRASSVANRARVPQSDTRFRIASSQLSIPLSHGDRRFS
jgi:hypothetical protein